MASLCCFQLSQILLMGQKLWSEVQREGFDIHDGLEDAINFQVKQPHIYPRVNLGGFEVFTYSNILYDKSWEEYGSLLSATAIKVGNNEIRDLEILFF